MSDEALDHDPPRRTWRLPFSWLGLVALAWVVYELTQSPALGAVLVCLKFGWEDFRTARWVWFNDPLAARRRSLFWLFLAWGLWKTALVAFLLSIGFALVARRNPLPPAAPPQALFAFLGTFLTTLVGFALSALLTHLAVFLAWRGQVRLWLDTAVHRARRHDYWPPTPFCDGRRNCLGQLILTAVVLSVLGTILLLLVLVPRDVAGLLVTTVGALLAPVVVVVGRELITHHVWADSPDECWPEALPPADTDPSP